MKILPIHPQDTDNNRTEGTGMDSEGEAPIIDNSRQSRNSAGRN